MPSLTAALAETVRVEGGEEFVADADGFVLLDDPWWVLVRADGSSRSLVDLPEPRGVRLRAGDRLRRVPLDERF